MRYRAKTARLAPYLRRSERISVGFNGRTGVRQRSSNSRTVRLSITRGGLETFCRLVDGRHQWTTVVHSAMLRCLTKRVATQEPAGICVAELS